jgi:hypothetical protein
MLSSAQTPIAVAPIDGDYTGRLRSQVIESIANSSYAYDPENPDYELHIEITQDATTQEDRDIGMRYAKSPSGDETDLVVSTERRALMTARITLTDLATNRAMPTITLRSTYDYDFDSDLLDDKAVSTPSGTVPLIRYSLGQLENAPAARETAYRLLEKKLAKSIVSYLELAR